jgi:drug/metabolite transporter (DMT)-like permease
MDANGMSSLRRGALYALAAAIAFGITAPLVKRAGQNVGPFATASLLYAGATLVSLLAQLRADNTDTPVRRSDAGRILGIGLLGALVAPVALAWGLQRTNAVTASLLLNAEAVFTVLLARAFYHEHFGRRVLGALTLIATGGTLLVLGDGHALAWSVGALAIVAASLAWAGDNTVGRVLADRDPAQVVLYKSLVGVTLSFTIAFLAHDARPTLAAALALVTLGATGYGLSLRLYLHAQRLLGAGRTGSIFAAGPFVGAGVAVALGDRAPTLTALAGGGLCALGVYLHVTEHHSHHHAHRRLQHDHLHTHDDAHHDHVHAEPIVGAHAHPHVHEPREHEHEHAPDLHHPHEHE